MSIKYPSSLVASACVTIGLACGDSHDEVAPGYYGPTPGAEMMAGAPLMPAPAARGGAATPPASSASSSNLAAPTASGSERPPGNAQLQGNAASPASAPTACDLSGRWLSTVHKVTDALGQLQYVHTYDYYEIEQQGDDFVISKGLRCGDDGKGTGLFAATVDFSATWQAVMEHVSYTGRKGASVEVAGGCQVDLEPWYMVIGATTPHFLDPSIPLPTAQDEATGSTPGWEDWDEDGNPGITGQIEGAVSGEIYVAPRSWTSATGVVEDVETSFTLPLQWDQEQNVMAIDGSSLLRSSASRASDAKLHFTEFARLQSGQATGDDAAICDALVELAPRLTPKAAGL